MITNKRTFKDAKDYIYSNTLEKDSIGLYQEKAIHSILKAYFEDDKSKCEIKVGKYIADIKNEYGIIEIQTKNFDKLRSKLEYYLLDNEVTIVYPIIKNKKIIWLNSDDEKDYNRISPRHKTIFSAFKELYKIKLLMKNDKIHYDFVFLDAVELKNLDGWDDTKKKHSSRLDFIPLEIIDELKLESYHDFSKLLDNIDGNFTVKSFKKINKCLENEASLCINVLKYLGLIEEIGKDGRSKVYKKVELC